MYRELVGILFIFHIILLEYINCIGYYTIVAPENIRPNSDYKISITVHDQHEPAKMRFKIVNEPATVEATTGELTISGNRTEDLVLHFNDFKVNDNYKLEIEGVDGIIFKNESWLNVESKNVSIFIQTDKGIYKPGENIKFRILVLDFELKPVLLRKSALEVYVTDADKNRIKQWLDIEPKKGVFSSELQLSELPVLGDWTITAKIDGETKTKTVQVAEYVLPKFEVTIESSSHFTIKDGKVRAIVRAKYTYGKFVKGKAIVTVTPTSYFAWTSRPKGDSVVKTVGIDGKGTIEFDITEDLKTECDEYRRSVNYEISAVVIEELTGRNQTATKDFTVHQTRYKITAMERDSTFQSGLPVKLSIAVTYHDDAPVLISESTKYIVLFKIPNNKNLSEEYFKKELSSNGTVKINIPTTKSDDSGFTLRAKYLDEESDIGYFYPQGISEPAALEIKILTKKPTLNKEVFVEIQSINLLEHFTYQIISCGRIVHSDSVAVPKRKYHVFSFLANFALVPKAHIIVYYLKNDEIISSKLDLEIRDDLNNFVKLKLSSNRLRPGKNVSIVVTTNPKSYVGLLGVDQSVLLLKKNDDLSIEDALNEREFYQYQFHDKNLLESVSASPYYYNSYWGNFRASRVVLFTNAKKDLAPLIREYESAGLFNKAGGVQAAAISYAGQPGAFHKHNPPPPAHLPPPPRIRKEFPETWLWQSISDDSFNGTIAIDKLVPDTITSWVISAFSLDPVTGLGLTKYSRTLEVFQPFFISLSLPYSIKRGEIVSIPVVIFNYLEYDLNAEVIFYNKHNEFDFIDADANDEAHSLLKRHLTIPSSNGITTSFLIKPKKAGAISIEVTATADLAGDGVVRILQVEPEGDPQSVNKAFFIDLNDVYSRQFNAIVDIPKEAVPDSEKISVISVGDLLGDTIQNLNSLIRLPSGCGEQNMVHFVPNIVVLNYLNVTERLTSDIEKKAKKYTEKGYQRQLTYRHDDGSFSAFGKSDKSGSTWLTAFVTKSFIQARPYISIDENIIDGALQWLSSIQKSDGSFPEIGVVSHKDMQGGSSQGIALTAYVVSAFLENKEKMQIYQETVDKAIDNIANGVKDDSDLYATAVVAYVLQLTNHPQKTELLQKLANQSSSKNDNKWWTKSSATNKATKASKTIDIEITAYGLLALLENKQYADSLSYFKWLLSQRNDLGGFEGTQDTVVGLKALAKFAERIAIKDSNVRIAVRTEATNETHVTVNAQNALVLQMIELPPTVRSVDITATGHGFALVYVTYRYHLNTTEPESSFLIKPRITDQTNGAHLKLEVCISFKPKDDTVKESNMAVLEVSMPSGFATETDSLLSLTNIENVKKVEAKDGETVVVIYFDSLKANVPICLLIDGYEKYKVADQKPASIIAYDYYDSSQSSRVFYSLPTKSSCDICEGENCLKLCR